MPVTRIYYTGAPPEMIDGDPPIDQSPLVAQLQEALTAANDALTAANDVLTVYKTFAQGVADRAALRRAADAAKVDGQDDLDAVAGLPT